MAISGKNQQNFLTSSKRWLCAGASLGILALAGACTTVEGGNAFADRETFGREVVDATAIGLGLKAPVYKEVPKNERAELVLPKEGVVAAPSEKSTAVIPEDSDGVIFDPEKVTPEMLRRIRSARVVDGLDLSGSRKLTTSEMKFITERVRQARLKFQQSREVTLFEPPKSYFTSLGGKDLVCLAADGDLVLLDDPKCPPAIRAALAKITAEEEAREKLRLSKK